ncbi:acyltransferase domain-containing protein [Sorangium sp. So ce375]|uniref:acyltransferase domain-containing protein n=1 Tax=Sorangium sp. So ce375 TaxID=3133306 RepID=UPI003F5C6A2B
MASIAEEPPIQAGDTPEARGAEARGAHSAPVAPARDTAELFLLSSSDGAGLTRAIDALISRAEAEPSVSLRRLARDNARQPVDERRLAVIALDRRDLANKLRRGKAALARSGEGRLRVRSGIYCGSGAPAGQVALLFPGQGSQYEGMLEQLYHHWPASRAWFDALDAAYASAREAPPSEIVFPREPAASEGERLARERRLVDMERGAQVGLIASLASHEMLLSLGVRADVMVGNSNGEHAALIAAGAIQVSTRRGLCDVIAHIGLSGRAVPAPPLPERMVAVNAFERGLLDALLARHEGQLFIAMDNCPSQVVIAGTLPAVDAAVDALGGAGAVCIRMPFERAYHTPLFGEWQRALRVHYDRFKTGVPHTPVRCCATCSPVPDEPSAALDLLAAQWSSPVRFRQMIEDLYDGGTRTFIEAGPNNRLTAFVEDTLRGKPHLAVPASSQHRGDTLQLKHLVGELYAHGLAIRVEPLDLLCDAVLRGTPAPVEPGGREASRGRAPALEPRGSPARAAQAADPARRAQAIRALHAALMAEAGEREARVLTAARRATRFAGAAPAPLPAARPGGPAAAQAAAAARADCPLLGDVLRLDSRELHAERRFDWRRDPFVLDHSLGPPSPQRRAGGAHLPVLPFTLSLEILAEAAWRLTGVPPASFSDIRAGRWLALDRGRLTVAVHAERMPEDGGDARVRVRLFEVGGPRRHLAFEGTVHVSAAPLPAPPPPLPPEPGALPPRVWSAERFYSGFAFHGRSYRGIERVLAVGERSIEAELAITALPGLDALELRLDPALLDCTGQLVAFWLLERGERQFGVFPFEARRVVWYRRSLPRGGRVRCRGHVRLDPSGTTEATFEMVDGSGAQVARVEGFQQRFVRFPGAIHRLLFGGGPPESGAPRGALEEAGATAGAVDALDRSFLSASWGIWARALAHVMLDERELDAWYRLGDDGERRVASLLSRVAAKDARAPRPRLSGGRPIHEHPEHGLEAKERE